MSVEARAQDLIKKLVPEDSRWKLDKEIDFEHKGVRGTVPEHLGEIADSMKDWEGKVADKLGLSDSDRRNINGQHPFNPTLQKRAALGTWKSMKGADATYKALIIVFLQAGEENDAANVCKLFVSDEAAVGESGDQGVPPQTSAAHTGGGFSSSMTPDQLAQWLLQVYGEAYKNDISKLERALINGVLFLELPDDNDFLEDLKLSPAFKRLVLKKAKEMKQSKNNAAATSTITAIDAPKQPTAILVEAQAGKRDVSVLSSDNHERLYSQLKVHSAKWREIGTHLGFHQPDLDKIQEKPALFMGAPDSWLSAMLTNWLQRESGDQQGRPTLENLKLAVSKAGLGRAAEELTL